MTKVEKGPATSVLSLWRALLPFADAASKELPLSRLLRLSLFQVSVGMAVVLLNGTLNRVMIVELGVSAWLVSAMVALPLVAAPFRALIGFKSDTHRSALGWRRVPYIWFGSLFQFGGLAIMPFALLILSGDTHGPVVIGHVAAAIAFVLVGFGLHTTQTAGLALATDLAPEETRPRVVALLYVMLLLGMAGSAILFGILLADFSQLQLIKVIQGAAVLTIVLNMIALWKQEVRSKAVADRSRPRPRFRETWQQFIRSGRTKRFLVMVALGAAAFSMQDILLEPYGGQIMGLSVGDTTMLTALLAGGTLGGFALAAHFLTRGADPFRIAAVGALFGIAAFSAVIFAAPLDSALVFRAGTTLIGFGGGLFSVGTLTAAMGMEYADGAPAGIESGLALGAWGAVHATATGLAIAMGGAVRDVTSALATNGMLGPALTGPSTGYMFVYHIEIALLFATLAALGPLVRSGMPSRPHAQSKFGIAEFPS